MVDRLLLGFDARLLQVPGRISVDAQDSPSAFDVLHLERPDWTGPVQGLWEDRDALEAALAAQRRKINDAAQIRLIAVAVLLDTCSPASIEWIDRTTPTNPREVGDQWRLLGFDVGDAYLESAIPMFSEQSRREFQLNEFSLVSDLEKARDVRDAAVRTHPQQSPFCIYEVWEVK